MYPQKRQYSNTDHIAIPLLWQTKYCMNFLNHDFFAKLLQILDKVSYHWKFWIIRRILLNILEDISLFVELLVTPVLGFKARIDPHFARFVHQLPYNEFLRVTSDVSSARPLGGRHDSRASLTYLLFQALMGLERRIQCWHSVWETPSRLTFEDLEAGPSLHFTNLSDKQIKMVGCS